MPTPAQWLVRLHKQLEDRRPMVDRCEAYYDGKHRLAFATTRFRETFGNLFGAFADNWVRLVVDASVERLAIDGFRFGDDESADQAAWEMWQRNELDAQSMFGHTEAVKCGEAYGLVAPGPDNEPIITVEHPSQCLVVYEPGMRRRRLAGYKEWLDEDGYLRANVYTAEVIAKYRTREKHRDGDTVDWVPYTGSGDAVQAHRLLAVPMVPFLNEPSMLRGGQSDIWTVIPQQDAVNKLVADMVVASEFAAFRQRWATGIEIPIDPVTGKPMHDKFLGAVNRMWSVPDESASFGEFEASDLGNYVKAIEMLVQHIAAQTRTPPHYLLGQSGAFPSGESLKSTETGLVAKVRRKQLTFGEAWEEIIRLGFRVKGDEAKASAIDAEVIWRDPESRTTGEQTDAAVKELALGVPKEMIWARRLGMSPQEIQRAKAMAAEESLFGGLGLGQPEVQPEAPPVDELVPQ